MYGAIIGELAGSVYEYPEVKDKAKGIININRRLEILKSNDLITTESFYGDDTILTVAILEAILCGGNYETKLREYILKYGTEKLGRQNFFEYMFSTNVTEWAKGTKEGNSIGNGSAMRVSSVGYLYDDINTVMDEARKQAIPSHNSIEAIKGAQAIASSIYLLRTGHNKMYVLNHIINNFDYELGYNISNLQKSNVFASTCNKTVPIALYMFLKSDCYEDAVRKTISIGGDTDTNACMAGSLAEAYYGVPPYLIKKAKEKLPDEFKEVIDYGYAKIKKKVI